CFYFHTALKPGVAVVKIYRIPALVNLNDDKTFLAFAEKRKTLSDTNAEVLVMRRGTLKDAKTQDIEVQKKNYEILFLSFLNLHSLSGRLIIPAYVYHYTGKPDCTSGCCLSFCCFTSFALAFYSDDQGITWKVGNQMDVESCECQMAEIIDEEGKSTLYCNTRTRLGYRSEALSYNSGEDFGTVLSPNKLIETGNGCQGSVLSFLEQIDFGLYLNKTPLDSLGWPDEPLLILRQGPSVYSDLVEYEPGCFACLMECWTEHENEEIAFVLFELPEKKL
uniref:Sialidase 3 (membrane sialidase), tandem duplicate 3 n=1 Tax=Sinocyclocheilus grahami TaxID=75366 RepID=A0A672RK80_SINGR